MTWYCWRCARIVYAANEIPEGPVMAFCHRCKAKNIVPGIIGDTGYALDRLPAQVVQFTVTTA